MYLHSYSMPQQPLKSFDHPQMRVCLCMNQLPLFSTVVPAIIFVFLSCRPFVAITTLSTGLVGVDNVVKATKGLQDRNINTQAGTTVENKGKLILTEIFPSVQYMIFFSIDN